MRFHWVLRFQGELMRLVERYVRDHGLQADELQGPAADVLGRMAAGQPGLVELSSEEMAEVAEHYESAWARARALDAAREVNDN